MFNLFELSTKHKLSYYRQREEKYYRLYRNEKNKELKNYYFDTYCYYKSIIVDLSFGNKYEDLYNTLKYTERQLELTEEIAEKSDVIIEALKEQITIYKDIIVSKELLIEHLITNYM